MHSREKEQGKSMFSARERKIFGQLAALAKAYGVERIALFGSRARRTHYDKSDFDLAVYGCQNFIDFSFDVEESIDTLLKFDLIDMSDEKISTDLLADIERDKVIVYEKI